MSTQHTSQREGEQHNARSLPLDAGSHEEQHLPVLGNRAIADRLEELAELLEAQNANPHRVRAYRHAAETVKNLFRPVHDILMVEGLAGLTSLPGIGQSLARSIEQLCHTGRLGLLERLRGDVASERIFGTVPGIGPELAARIHETLGIETLADLEVAAYNGKLARVSGMGRKRVRAVQESLAGRFRRRPRAPEPSVQRRMSAQQPPVEELLEIDAEYRREAKAGRLVRIAPRRFNPLRAAWLPILHTTREDRHYSALYSNTARAHELGTTNDWVVIYRDDPDADGQWTVITARFGPLQGKRIVRGREPECAAYYAQIEPSTNRANTLANAGRTTEAAGSRAAHYPVSSV